jgi:hypothetical protein
MGRAAVIARAKAALDDSDPFWAAKLVTTRFFADHFLTQVLAWPIPLLPVRLERSTWLTTASEKAWLFVLKPKIAVIIAGFSTLPYLIRMVEGLSQKEFACVITKSFLSSIRTKASKCPA